jgi:hypothetical protein
MIPTLTIDMTATLAPFGYAALAVVAAGLISVVTAAFRARGRRNVRRHFVPLHVARRAAA